jgi:hypothetical protein
LTSVLELESLAAEASPDTLDFIYELLEEIELNFD